jgi:aryl-alcohol dehydrogenase-like predicted oxidoreductase
MWNAGMRDFERDIIPICSDEGMGLCPYGTLNQGRFQTEAGFKEREKRKDGGISFRFQSMTDESPAFLKM